MPVLRTIKGLDDSKIVGLNTLIACEGVDEAEAVYRRRCQQNNIQPEDWAIMYLRKYRLAARKSYHPFIDVKAAKWALEEARRYL